VDAVASFSEETGDKDLCKPIDASNCPSESDGPEFSTWWTFSNSQLEERLQKQSTRLKEAKRQLQAILNKMPEPAKVEAAHLQQRIDDVQLHRKVRTAMLCSANQMALQFMHAD
jgi:hypothetical protein